MQNVNAIRDGRQIITPISISRLLLVYDPVLLLEFKGMPEEKNHNQESSGGSGTKNKRTEHTNNDHNQERRPVCNPGNKDNQKG